MNRSRLPCAAVARGAFLRLDCDGDGALSASDLSAGLRGLLLYFFFPPDTAQRKFKQEPSHALAQPGTTPDEHRDRDSSGLFPTLSLRARIPAAESKACVRTGLACPTCAAQAQSNDAEDWLEEIRHGLWC